MNKTTDKHDLRKKKDLEILKSFLYKGYGGDILSIHVFDRITKRVYAGNIHISNWKREEILKKKSEVKKK